MARSGLCFSLELMKRIGRYELQAELGRGGFGQVFRAHDPKVGRAVAIKVLLAAEEPELLVRFRSEAAAAGKLRHRNIITIYDFGEQDNVPYLVMEYLEGDDLERIIACRRQLSLLQKLDIMAQAASGLHHAHLHGTVHRDIKPANLMILPDGTVKIMDFGIALLSQATAARITPQGSLLGTFPYMSPEQFYGAASDPLTDLFAYGVTCYKLLTGIHPFQAPEMGGMMYNIVNKAPSPIRDLVPQCPEALEDAVSKMLAKERDARYQSLEDVKFDLEPIIAELRRDRIGELINEARALVARGQFTPAQPLVREVLEIDAGNKAARELRDEIQRGIKESTLRPQIEALLHEGQIEAQAHHYDQAIRKFESALRLNKSDPEIQELIQRTRAEWEQQQHADRLVAEARRALDVGDITAANKGITDALSAFPEHNQAKALVDEVRRKLQTREREMFLRDGLGRARGFLLLQSFEAALELLNSLHGEYPESSDVTRLLADATVAHNAKIRRERLQSATEEVKALISQRKFADAADLVNRLLPEFPESTELSDLGSFAAEEDRSQKRAAFIARVTAETSALVGAGNFDEALNRLRSALQEHPTASILRERLQAVNSARSEKLRKEALERTRAEAAELIANRAFSRALDCIGGFTAAYGDSAELDRLRRSAEEELEKQKRIAAIRKLLSQAQGLMDEGRPTTASEVLQQATTQFPGDSDVTRLLGAAQDQLREQRRVQEVSSIIAQAENLSRSKNFTGSLQLLEEALGRFPLEKRLIRSKEAILAVRAAEAQQQTRARLLEEVNALWRSGQLERALLVIRATAESEETKFLATDGELLNIAHQIEKELQERQREEKIRQTVEQAETLIAQGNLLSATTILNDAVKNFPSNPQLTRLFQLADERRREQDRADAIHSIVQNARERRNAGQLEGAANALRAALFKYPGDASLQNELQLVAEAKQALDREQKLARLRSQIHDFLDRNEPERAAELLREQIPALPDERDLPDLLNTAERLAEHQKKKQAIAKLVEQGSALAREGRLPDALACVDAALAKFPTDESLLSLRADIQTRQIVATALVQAEDLRVARELDQALQVIDDALWRAPDERSLLDIRSRVQADIAARERKEAVEKVVQIGLALVANQRYADAVSSLQQAVTRFPDEPRLSDLLRRAQHDLAEEQRNWELGRIRLEAEALLRDGRAEEAAGILETAPNATTELRDLLNRARSAFADKRRGELLAESIDLCEQSRYEEALALLQRGIVQYGESHETAQLRDRLEKELETQRQREARDRDLASLLSLEGEIAVGVGRRKLRQAQRELKTRLSAYANDSEIAQIGTRIQRQLETALEKKPVNWKRLASAIAAAAVLAAASLIVLWVLRNRSALVPVEIRTDPPGASVQLGTESCTTPNCRFDIKPGQYPLEASLSGYQKIQRSVTVYTGKERHFMDLVLEPLPPPPSPSALPAGTGTLIVKTGQPRVLVSVDGTPSKRTDEHGLTTLELPAGTHSVRIAKQGFETPDEQKIAIAANDSQTLAFDLIPQTIASQPKTGGGAITTTPPPTSAPTPPAAPSPEELEAQAWQVAHSAGDPAQLANFLAKYPNGAHVTEARIQLDDADWSRVNTSDMQSLKTYISQHSTGRHAREASSRIAYLDYMNLDKSDESALRAYLNEHPDSPYYAQVQSLISAIEAGKSAARSPQPSDTGPKSSGVQPETFGITSALTLFNSAFKRKQPKDVKKIWPSVPDEYIESMRQPGATYLMQLTPNPNAAPEINGDTASIRCDLSITIKRAGKSQETSRPVKVRLQKVSGSWSIVDVLGT